METRKSTQSDIEYVQANPFEEAVKGYPALAVPPENCWTFLVDGKIWAIGGYVVLWPGVGEIWMMTAKDFKDRITEMKALFVIRTKVQQFIDDGDLRRTQAVIRADFPQAIKMIEFLGFQREGYFREYYPDGCDAIPYVKLRSK